MDPNAPKYLAVIFLIFENDARSSAKKIKGDVLNESFRISCDCKSVIKLNGDIVNANIKRIWLVIENTVNVV